MLFFRQILTGSLKETSFEWPEKTSTANDLDPDDIHEMVKKGESIYKSEEVAYINGKNFLRLKVNVIYHDTELFYRFYWLTSH